MDRIIRTAFKAPAWPTIHPDLKNTITPKMFMRQEVKTPSQVPKSTGWETKKFDFHQGSAFCKNKTLQLTRQIRGKMVHCHRNVHA